MLHCAAVLTETCNFVCQIPNINCKFSSACFDKYFLFIEHNMSMQSEQTNEWTFIEQSYCHVFDCVKHITTSTHAMCTCQAHPFTFIHSRKHIHAVSTTPLQCLSNIKHTHIVDTVQGCNIKHIFAVYRYTISNHSFYISYAISGIPVPYIISSTSPAAHRQSTTSLPYVHTVRVCNTTYNSTVHIQYQPHPYSTFAI
jgi:hypothetical protein